MPTEADNLHAEAQCLRALASFRSGRAGDFLQSISGELNVMAADFEAQAKIAEIVGGPLQSPSDRSA